MRARKAAWASRLGPRSAPLGLKMGEKEQKKSPLVLHVAARGLKGSFCQGPDSSETAAFFGPEGAKSVALGSDFNKKRGAALGENVT